MVYPTLPARLADYSDNLQRPEDHDFLARIAEDIADKLIDLF